MSYSRIPQAELGVEQELGSWYDPLVNILKTGSDAYQASKAGAQTPQTPVVPPQQSFLSKHGGKIVIVGIGVAAFFILRRRKK